MTQYASQVFYITPNIILIIALYIYCINMGIHEILCQEKHIQPEVLRTNNGVFFQNAIVFYGVLEYNSNILRYCCCIVWNSSC